MLLAAVARTGKGSLELPEHLDDEDQKGSEQAEQHPVVDVLEVGRVGQSGGGAFKHGDDKSVLRD